MTMNPVAVASSPVEETLRADREYWLRKLSGERTPAGVPPDRSRPAHWTPERDHVAFDCGLDVVEPLRAMCGESASLAFVPMLAALKVVLHRYSGARDVVIGTTIHNRFKDVSLSNRDLALCDAVAGDMTARTLLNDVKVTLFEAFAHQRYPFSDVLSLLGVQQRESRGALFDVAATLETVHDPPDASRLRHDVTCRFSLLSDRLEIGCEYRSALFRRETIDAFGGHVTMILRGLLAHPDARVADLDLMPPHECRAVMGYVKGRGLEYPDGRTLATLFEEQAVRTPAHAAVADDHEAISCGELNRRANQLARSLRGLGVGPETVVGVFMERSIDLVVAVLGILKAGGAYAPLDRSYPPGRLALMLEDASIDLVLVRDAASRSGLPGGVRTVVSLADERPAIERQSDSNPRPAAFEDNTAYVIFTSGSTGRPKGVLVTHRSIVNHMLWMQNEYPLNERHRVLQRTPFSFDASVWEFWAPLLAGARLCLASPGLQHDTAYLKRAIAQHEITTIQLVPSLLRLLLDQETLEDCASLERVFCGGEPLTCEVQQAFFSRSGAGLHNLYGPTEATVEVTAWCCERTGDRRVVPLGRPIANAEIYILDRELRPAGINVPGELCIGGRALARGYVGRPESTAERFLPNPFAHEPGARMYRSGDMARWMPDGTIEFLGRADHQVKIRGLRIELGEIEAVLGAHPGVRAAVAVARGQAHDLQRLVAYVVFRRKSPPSVPELGALLRSRLPENMVPSSIVVLPALPRSPNGKIDYRALPDPVLPRQESDPVEAAPRSQLDTLIAEIWKSVLRAETVGLHDNFFDIGGHSLLVLQVHGRLRKALSRKIEITDLFQYPTIHTLARYLERNPKR